MSKNRLKRIIWLFLLLLVATTMVGVLRGIGDLLAYFQQGADPASALNIVPNKPPDLNVSLQWLPDDADTGRIIDPFTRTQIESVYLRAWLQWNFSYTKGQPFGLKTYFVGPALAAINESVQHFADQGLSVEQVDTTHRLQLHLYSADGSIVSLTDHGAAVAQIIRDHAGNVVYAGETYADYDVVLFLEDGNWRVRHWVRRQASDDTLQAAQNSCSHCLKVKGTALEVDGKPYRVAGINYYPQKTPWDQFWAQYDPQIIDADFTRINTLGLNTLRIFVHFQQFGGAHVDPRMLGKLTDLLNRAEAHHLKVIVTLFDFYTDYRLIHWPDADRHVQTLLTTFADHPAILAWDVKNEPDLDYGSFGSETVDSWLRHIIHLAHRYDSHHPITIGWSTPAAVALTDTVDLVSFHYAAPATELPAQYARVRQTASSKPLLVSEFALPTWNSFFFPRGHTEAEQAAYYADVVGFLRSSDSVGTLSWTLYDFNHVPTTVAGRWPWQIGPQRHMGILRSDGTPKPAAALLAPDAPLDVLRPPVWSRFLKPFWLLLIVLGMTSATLWVRGLPHSMETLKRVGVPLLWWLSWRVAVPSLSWLCRFASKLARMPGHALRWLYTLIKVGMRVVELKLYFILRRVAGVPRDVFRFLRQNLRLMNEVWQSRTRWFKQHNTKMASVDTRSRCEAVAVPIPRASNKKRRKKGKRKRK